MGTTYYIRAYATNGVGTAYGNELTATKSANLPVLTTAAVTSLASTSVTSGGTISNDGGSEVTARGVCWSTSPSPTISNSKTTDGSGSGTFTSNLTGLLPGTAYYVRAYLTNSVETAYGSQVSFTTSSTSGSTVTDIDGNVYNTVTIGTQVWMVENLKTTKYRNGDPIANVTDNAAWAALATGAYCWYNNDATTYKATYGALYNWYAVADSRNIAPAGWHVPTDAEWTTLTDYLGGESVAGGKLKETGTSHWLSPNTGATNSSLFTAVPNGSRASLGVVYNIGYTAIWWSSSDYSSDITWSRLTSLGNSDVYRSSSYKMDGLSVRCVRD